MLSARLVVAALTLPLLVACGDFPSGECDNPNVYRVLALASGRRFERRDARIRCTQWSTGCSSETAAPGTSSYGEGRDCTCGAYLLTAGDFRVDIPAASLGAEIPLPQGRLTITKAEVRHVSCAQGDYYVNYSGTFEGTIGGQTYERGVFYALEVH